MDCPYPKTLVVLPYVEGEFTKDGRLKHRITFLNTKTDNTFNPFTGEVGRLYSIPCGKCIACRQNKAHEWQLRCMMEAEEYKEHPEKMCFLTLTYDDLNLPYNENGKATLNYEDVQKFIDYLRKLLKRKGENVKLRFLCTGEYGTHGKRPHYHIILFGYDFFKDSIPTQSYKSSKGNMLFSNPLIDKAWCSKGYASFGTVTPASIMYTCQYATKKLVNGYDEDEENGLKTKSFIQASRRPGIGGNYVRTHKEDIIKNNGCYLNGQFISLNAYMINLLLRDGDISDLDRFQIAEIKKEFAETRVNTWYEENPDYAEKTDYDKKVMQNYKRKKFHSDSM